MSNDPGSGTAAPRKKNASRAGFVASLLGILVLALYIVYVSGPAAHGPWLRLGLMALSVLSIAAGLYALVRRRWIGGLIGIVAPALLPLLDWLFRMAAR